LTDVVGGTVERGEDDTAAFSWFTIDLTRFFPCEIDESISMESEYRFIIRKWKRICVYARAHTDAIRFYLKTCILSLFFSLSLSLSFSSFRLLKAVMKNDKCE
jgi:hypothetical protein